MALIENEGGLYMAAPDGEWKKVGIIAKARILPWEQEMKDTPPLQRRQWSITVTCHLAPLRRPVVSESLTLAALIQAHFARCTRDLGGADAQEDNGEVQ